MRVTIIAEDSVVLVDGQALTVDLSGLDEEIHAIQWHDGRGEIEYKYDEESMSMRSNFVIVDFSPYQVFLDRWTMASQQALEAQNHSPSENEEPMHVFD